MEERPISSESDAVAKPIPPPAEVLPGMWSIPLPLRGLSLGYVLVYAIEAGDRLLLIDAGWDTPEVRTALNMGLNEMGTDLSAVTGVIVTHMHVDHFGLAETIREASGAWIAMHPADARVAAETYDPERLIPRLESWLTAAGVPIVDIGGVVEAALDMGRLGQDIQPDLMLEDGAKVILPGWDLRVVHTPGHTPGHICLWSEDRNAILTGDHVLPRISPNISFQVGESADPLGDFLDSLERLLSLQAENAFPAHEWRFDKIPHRIRDLKSHHDRRLAEVDRALRGGAETVWDVARELTWSRGWQSLDGSVLRAALGETHAHLAYLQQRERAILVSEPAEMPLRWQSSKVLPRPSDTGETW